MKGTKNDMKKKLEEDEFGLLSDGNEINPINLIDPGFIEISRLEAGASFGELALIDGKPRMATIKCLKRCHFLVLSKKEFQKSLEDIK
jgi:CRP-like cAMP-binding protein